MNKSVYLGFSTLKLSKILMYEFLYDYVKPIVDIKQMIFIKILPKMLKLDLTLQFVS